MSRKCHRCGGPKSKGMGKRICDDCRAKCPNVIHRRMYRACSTFGIEFADCERLHAKQNGCCVICGEKEQLDSKGRGLHMDHDHFSGNIRGLLCARCNLMIGYARDKPHILRRGADYLEQPPAIVVGHKKYSYKNRRAVIL